MKEPQAETLSIQRRDSRLSLRERSATFAERKATMHHYFYQPRNNVIVATMSIELIIRTKIRILRNNGSC